MAGETTCEVCQRPRWVSGRKMGRPRPEQCKGSSDPECLYTALRADLAREHEARATEAANYEKRIADLNARIARQDAEVVREREARQKAEAEREEEARRGAAFARDWMARATAAEAEAKALREALERIVAEATNGNGRTWEQWALAIMDAVKAAIPALRATPQQTGGEREGTP